MGRLQWKYNRGMNGRRAVKLGAPIKCGRLLLDCFTFLITQWKRLVLYCWISIMPLVFTSRSCSNTLCFFAIWYWKAWFSWFWIFSISNIQSAIFFCFAPSFPGKVTIRLISSCSTFASPCESTCLWN